jgi:hypothetical protein
MNVTINNVVEQKLVDMNESLRTEIDTMKKALKAAGDFNEQAHSVNPF